MDQRFFTSLYRIFLSLYPRRFREEFGSEMEAVFTEAISEAASRGQAARILLKELSSLPAEAIRQGWHSLSRRPVPAGWEGPPTWKEALVALALFALPAAQFMANGRRETYPEMVWVAGGGVLLLAILVAGFSKGFPRWSLPYLGLALSATSFTLTFQQASDLTAPAFISRLGLDLGGSSGRLLFEIFWSGMTWLSLFVLTFLVLGVLSVLRRFRPFLERIRQDWTLASYIFYSGTLFTLLFFFDRYRSEVTSAAAITLCLSTGAWLFLCSPQPWQRMLALLAGLTLAMWTAIAGQWPALLREGQDWLSWQASASEGWFEARQAVFLWGWMVVGLLSPVLLRFLPRREPARGHSGSIG